MAFFSPSATSRKIASISNTATSAGSTTYLFNIPQDADAIVAKFWTGTLTPTGTNGAQVTIQTSEDGGTTWRDVAAWTTQATVVNDNAHFASIPCISLGGRGVANWVGSVQASTLAAATTASIATGIASGLPMLGTLGRIQVTITGTLTANGGVNCDIFAPTTKTR